MVSNTSVERFAFRSGFEEPAAANIRSGAPLVQAIGGGSTAQQPPTRGMEAATMRQEAEKQWKDYEVVELLVSVPPPPAAKSEDAAAAPAGPTTDTNLGIFHCNILKALFFVVPAPGGGDEDTSVLAKALQDHQHMVSPTNENGKNNIGFLLPSTEKLREVAQQLKSKQQVSTSTRRRSLQPLSGATTTNPVPKVVEKVIRKVDARLTTGHILDAFRAGAELVLVETNSKMVPLYSTCFPRCAFDFLFAPTPGLADRVKQARALLLQHAGVVSDQGPSGGPGKNKNMTHELHKDPVLATSSTTSLDNKKDHDDHDLVAPPAGRLVVPPRPPRPRAPSICMHLRFGRFFSEGLAFKSTGTGALQRSPGAWKIFQEQMANVLSCVDRIARAKLHEDADANTTKNATSKLTTDGRKDPVAVASSSSQKAQLLVFSDTQAANEHLATASKDTTRNHLFEVVRLPFPPPQHVDKTKKSDMQQLWTEISLLGTCDVYAGWYSGFSELAWALAYPSPHETWGLYNCKRQQIRGLILRR